MSFSDEDLKRLNECVEQPFDRLRIGLINYKEHTPQQFDLVALLARLEAAEKVCQDAKECSECNSWSPTIEDLEVWRQSKGEKSSPTAQDGRKD